MNLRTCLCVTGIFLAIGIQSATAACNTIDAITTASFKITGGGACSTEATFKWSFTRSNGEMYIEYGKTDAYGTKKTFVPNAGNNPYKISTLTPNTTYYFHFSGFYASKNINRDYYKSTFKTSGGAITSAEISPVVSSAAPVASLYFGTTRLKVPGFSSHQPLSVALYSLNGTRIMSRSIPQVAAGLNASIALPSGVVPGMYLVKLSNAAGSSTQSIMIRN